MICRDFATATRNYARQQMNYHRKGEGSLFLRMDRQLNPNRSPFHRSNAKDPRVKRPPPLVPLADAVSRLTDEVLHWCSVTPEEFSQRVLTQQDQGKAYGKLMRNKSIPPDYSIENSPDGDPKFVRYLLARMVKARLLKIPSEEQQQPDWVRSLLDREKGVTPDTVTDPRHRWTAEGKPDLG